MISRTPFASKLNIENRLSMSKFILDLNKQLDDLTGAVNMCAPVVGVPASASAPGSAGSIAYDASYLYICVATNTWKRVAISTW